MDRTEHTSDTQHVGRQRASWREALGKFSVVALLKELRSELATCKTVLDIGCGESSPMRFLPARLHLAGVDGYAPAMEQARKLRTHDEYFVSDVRKIGESFKERQFDACVALDVIEHLTKEDGFRLLESMEKLATRRVIVFTPNGFVPQHSQQGDLQEHLSGWTAEEMRSRGYRVRGMYGPKSLRGEYNRVKYWPRIFWVFVTLACHFLHTRRHPENSASIFCVKSLNQTT
jgi:hypothetical protein